MTFNSVPGRFVRILLYVLLPSLAALTHATNKPVDVRVYVLDCGRLNMRDTGMFDDSGALDGKPGTMSVPCFLIRHPKGYLLWDTGLGDTLADHPAGADFSSDIHARVQVKLVDQLKALRLKPSGISYLAFSHWHVDHTGNANLLGNATWILQRRELHAATGRSPPPFEPLAAVAAYKHANIRLVDGDTDVFGDDSVRLVLLPGHTPGHQALQLRLPHAGVVILSGDLYHSREARQLQRVPRGNVDRAATLASMRRFEAIVAHAHARVVIQHDPRDVALLPPFPAYLH